MSRPPKRIAEVLFAVPALCILAALILHACTCTQGPLC